MSITGIASVFRTRWWLICSLSALCGIGGLSGLCTAAPANTTGIPGAAVSMLRMTQDLRLTPSSLAERLSGEALMPAMPVMPVESTSTLLAVAPFVNIGLMPGRIRVALLLPMRSPALRGAAEMVRDGFRAGHQRDGANVDFSIIETDDDPQNIAALYRDAIIKYDVLVGPLSRSGVTAVATGGNVTRPTIALGQPEPVGGLDPILPPMMLVMGLSIEEEARQAADWAARLHPGARALVLSTGVAWQRRAARAFSNHWKRGDASADTLETTSVRGGLAPAELSNLKKRLDADAPGVIFVALDAAQTRQLRQAIGKRGAVYGTSQLNALNLAESSGAEPQPELDGVRLLDLPWQLQVDHPAVMSYASAATRGAQRRSPDFERLYALGIDAFRVASEIGAGHQSFTLDGVTGQLAVQFDGIRPAVFTRSEQQARYTAGAVAPVIDGR